jgi:phasin family protein
MSYLTAEQMVAAHKANVETLFGLTQKAFEGVEKLVELNIQVAKTAMVEAADTTKAALSVKDAQELLALQQAMLQPAAEKAASTASRLLRSGFTRRSRLGVSLLATARAVQRSGPSCCQSSCTNQSGKDCSKASRRIGSVGGCSFSPASIARAALRSRPFTTGAREASR